MLLPVTPSAVDLKQKADKKTVSLMSGDEIAILGKLKLAEISFSFILPRQEYPFARYNGGFKEPEYFFEQLGQMFGNPVQFKIIEMGVDRTMSIEDYQIKESAADGDVEIKIRLKDYRTAKTRTFSPAPQTGAVVEKKTREVSENAPAPKVKPKSYTVKSGDTLWAIAKHFYGDGGKYPEIAKANNLDNPNLIFPGQVFVIPVV